MACPNSRAGALADRGGGPRSPQSSGPLWPLCAPPGAYFCAPSTCGRRRAAARDSSARTVVLSAGRTRHRLRVAAWNMCGDRCLGPTWSAKPSMRSDRASEANVSHCAIADAGVIALPARAKAHKQHSARGQRVAPLCALAAMGSSPPLVAIHCADHGQRCPASRRRASCFMSTRGHIRRSPRSARLSGFAVNSQAAGVRCPKHSSKEFGGGGPAAPPLVSEFNTMLRA